MSPQEVDELMKKRGFTLGATFNSGIRMYSYTDIERTPIFIVSVIPERNEFKFTYKHLKSINSIETPWCSPINDKLQFKRILKGFKQWVNSIEELYEEE